MSKILKKYIVPLIAIALIVSGLSACTSPSAEAIPFSIDPDKTLIVYSSHKADVYTPIIREFEKRTGITVEVHAGGTMQVLNEIKNGAEADLMFGGGIELFQQYSDLIEPYVAKEQNQVESRYSSKEGKYTLFSDLPFVFVFNRKLVNEEDAPKSWNDFLSSKWIGKIAFANPHNSGTSITILLSFMSLLDIGEKNAVNRFSNQLNGELLRSSGDVLPSIETGSSLVGIALEETALKWTQEHDDVGIIYPVDGTVSIPDGSFLIKDCAHRENAEKFIDFTISKDVQRLLVDKMYRRSVRTDVEPSVQTPEINYADFDLGWALRTEGEALSLWDTANQ